MQERVVRADTPYCSHHRMTLDCWECKVDAKKRAKTEATYKEMDDLVAPGLRHKVETRQDKAIPTVPERLQSLGAIYEERSKVYGDNYLHFGKVMMGCFPRGITLETEEEFTRFCIFVQMASKMTRYGQAFKHGGHPDSLDDNAVYSQMLSEADELLKGAA